MRKCKSHVQSVPVTPLSCHRPVASASVALFARSGNSAPERTECSSSPEMTDASKSSRPAGAWFASWDRGLLAESVK